MDLVITLRAAAGKVVHLAIAGEIDMATSDQLATAITDALKLHYPAELIIDFAEVSFIDSTGVRALVGGWRQASERGTRCRVVNPSAMTCRVLATCGVLDTLTGGAPKPGPQ